MAAPLGQLHEHVGFASVNDAHARHGVLNLPAQVLDNSQGYVGLVIIAALAANVFAPVPGIEHHCAQPIAIRASSCWLMATGFFNGRHGSKAALAGGETQRTSS